MSEVPLFCIETYETCERGTSRSVHKLMSEVPLLCTQTCDGRERNSPLFPENLRLSRYFGAERRAEDVHQNF